MASSTLSTRCFCQNEADLMHLLTGATGYVGGRLLGRLQREGLPVRCLCRNPEAMRWRVTPGIELVQGDLHQPESLGKHFPGWTRLIYLVHSMQEGGEFESRENQAAENFALAARTGGSAAHHLFGRAGAWH